MFVGIDIGGTTTRIAATTALDSLVYTKRDQFPTSKDFQDDFAKIITFIDSLRSKPQSIGISIASPVDTSFLIPLSNNLQHYVNKPLKQMLEEKYSCNVFIGNDGITSTLAEVYYDGHTKTDFVSITWGTGIAASIYASTDKPTVTRLKRKDYFPDWEELFSGEGILKTYEKKAEFLTDKEWQHLLTIFANQLSMFIKKTDKKLVIFSGGIAVKQWKRIVTIKDVIYYNTGASIKLTQLGEDASLAGAFALVKDGGKTIFIHNLST